MTTRVLLGSRTDDDIKTYIEFQSLSSVAMVSKVMSQPRHDDAGSVVITG